MPQQQSPFLEGKYGWNYGENGWNNGMDENLLKFSFMFDGNVNSIVASLPPVSNGAAHFNSTDNRFYFGIGSVWYSSPCPKSFIFKIKSNGDFYQFNGVSAVKIDNPSEIDSRLDAVELTLSSLGTAAFQNVEDFATQSELDIVEGQAQSYTDALRDDLADDVDPAKGAGLVANAVRTVHSLAALRLLSGRYNRDVIHLVGYYADAPGIGGGEFIWDADSTVVDDGGSVIGSLPTGRWFRSLHGHVTPEMFGARGDGVSDDTTAMQAAAAHIDTTRRALHLDSKTYLITGTVEFVEPPTIKGAAYSPPVKGRFQGVPYPVKNTVILCNTGGAGAIKIQDTANYKRGLHITDIHVLGVADKSATFGVLIKNCGWGGYVRGLVVERFGGIGLYLSQLQDTLFDQLEVLDCGIDNVNPALLISDYSNLLAFVRPRLENNTYQMLIAGGFGFEFHSPHFEQGDYPGTEAEVGDLLNINSSPSIRIQATSMVKFFGGSITGATAGRQIEKFGYTSAAECPYHMTVASDCTDVALHGTTIGFGYNNGRAISFYGAGGLFGCELIGLSPDAPSVELANPNAKMLDCTLRITDGGFNNTMWCVSGNSGGASIRGNTFICENSGAVSKTVGAIVGGTHSLGDNDYKVAKYNLISDNSTSGSNNLKGVTSVNLTGSVDLRKFDKNTVLVNDTAGSMTSLAGMVFGSEITIKNVASGNLTIPHGGNISLVGGVDAVIPPGGYIRFYADPGSFALTELFRRFS